MQYGGWYNNPATGRNQRWFNGVWTDGEEPNKSQSSNSGNATFNQYNSMISGEVNKYVDELIGQARGDYDFAAKYIEAQYKQALGSDDTKAQEFLKTVANSLEEKVGRIVFDYQTNTYRHEQDVKVATDRTVQGKDLALKRLAEDEQVLKEQATQQANVDREQQGATLNERGILSSTRENATGLAGKEVASLETDIQGRMSALERAGMRGKEDIIIGANQSLEDIGLADQRGKEDLMTDARRGAQNMKLGKDQQSEEALKLLSRKLQQYEAERRSSLNQAKPYADYLARGALGLG